MMKKIPSIAIAAVQNSCILKLLLLIPLILLIGACANNSKILLEEDFKKPLSELEFAKTGREAILPVTEEAQFITYEPESLMPEEAQEQVLAEPQITQNVPQEPELVVPQITQNMPQEPVLPVEGQVLPVPPQSVAQAPQSLAPVISAPEQQRTPAEMPVLPPVIEQPAKPAIPVYILGQGQIDAEILSEFLVFYHPEMYNLSR
jgi:hypothetical protein